MVMAPQWLAAHYGGLASFRLSGPTASFLLPLMFLWSQRQLAQGITLVKIHGRKGSFLSDQFPNLTDQVNAFDGTGQRERTKKPQIWSSNYFCARFCLH